MAVRGIKYKHNWKKKKEPPQYESVEIYIDKDNRKLFNTGDFVKDWFDAVKFVLTGGLGKYPNLSDSSSVNHFIMDGGSKLYDSAYLHINETSAELEYTYDHEKEGFELFVPKGTRPTWIELKEICK